MASKLAETMNKTAIVIHHNWQKWYKCIKFNKTYISQTKTNCLRTIPKKSLPLLLAFIATFNHFETFTFFTFKWTLTFIKRFILLQIWIYCLNEALEQHHSICLFLFVLGFFCSSKNCVSSLLVTSTNLEGISMFFFPFYNYRYEQL